MTCIDARFVRGPLDGKHQALPQAYREYLIPVPQDPLRLLDTSGLLSHASSRVPAPQRPS